MNNDRVNEVYFGENASPESTQETRTRVRWICSQVEGERVLDLGCSQGIVSLLLAREGRTITGVDLEAPALFYAAAERLRESRATRSRLRLLRADGAALPLPSNSFDCVILTEVLEHLDDPEPLLEEVERVLVDSGRLVVTCPFGLMPHPDHRQVYYPSSLLDRLGSRFFPLHLDIQGARYIRFTGERRRAPAIPETTRRTSERLSVEGLQEKEERYVAEQSVLRNQLEDARDKYRTATATIHTLKQRLEGQRATAGDTAEPRSKRRRASGAGEPSTPESESAALLATAELRSQSLEGELKRLSEALEAAAEENWQKRDLMHQRAREVEEARDLVARMEKRLTVQRGLVARHDRRIKNLALRLRTYERSKLWRLVHLYWRFQTELVRGGRQQRRGFLSSLRDGLVRRLPWRRRMERRRELRLSAYLDSVTRSRSPWFVFMFSGTTFIQEHRGNRPIRLSRVLLSRHIPVLFSYWRWKKSEAIPHSGDPNLLQMPIDLTLERMERIARHEYGDKKKIFVITFPHVSCARFVNLFNSQGWKTLYDVRDDWEEFHKVGAARWYHESLERYIANNSAVVTAVSRPLQEKIQSYLEEGRVELSPNALDTRFPTGRRIKVRPVDGRKTIGYVGHLTAAWFDWEALIETARARPDWTLEIVGHSAPSDLELPPNLEHLGPMDYRGIIRTARRWRVALIPFKICTLADGVDPIKVYEYLSLGLPVVSFRMPQIHDYPYVYIAHDRRQFVERIEEALEVRMEAAVIREFLQRNRWEDRVDAMLARAGATASPVSLLAPRAASAESAA